MDKEHLLVIPARYQSSRFPGKPLADIKGKSMLQRVWEKCVGSTSPENVIVATDDLRIKDHCNDLEINVIETPKECLTGTDRVAEVAKKLKAKFYVNVQGDEPLINSDDIEKVIDSYDHESNVSVCAMTGIQTSEDFYNTNIPKVVTDQNLKLLYISRAGIPASKDQRYFQGMKQVCIYALSPAALAEFGVSKKKTENELIEDIEILRLLDKGYEVKMVEVSDSSVAVDIKEDITKVLEKLNEEL